MGADGGTANCGVFAYGAPHEAIVELDGSAFAGARAASRSTPLLNRGGSRREAAPSMPIKEWRKAEDESAGKGKEDKGEGK